MIGCSVQHPCVLILERNMVISILNALESSLVLCNRNKLGQEGLPGAFAQVQLHRPRSLSKLLRERQQHRN